eukprot:SAG11_NODE_19494_length_465_cov_1.407104_2_plen_108_part_01
MLTTVGDGMKNGHILKLRQCFDRLRVILIDQSQSIIESVVDAIIRTIEAKYKSEQNEFANDAGVMVVLAETTPPDNDEAKRRTERAKNEAKQRVTAELEALVQRAEEA